MLPDFISAGLHPDEDDDVNSILSFDDELSDTSSKRRSLSSTSSPCNREQERSKSSSSPFLTRLRRLSRRASSFLSGGSDSNARSSSKTNTSDRTLLRRNGVGTSASASAHREIRKYRHSRSASVSENESDGHSTESNAMNMDLNTENFPSIRKAPYRASRRRSYFYQFSKSSRPSIGCKMHSESTITTCGNTIDLDNDEESHCEQHYSTVVKEVHTANEGNLNLQSSSGNLKIQPFEEGRSVLLCHEKAKRRNAFSISIIEREAARNSQGRLEREAVESKYLGARRKRSMSCGSLEKGAKKMEMCPLPGLDDDNIEDFSAVFDENPDVQPLPRNRMRRVNSLPDVNAISRTSQTFEKDGSSFLSNDETSGKSDPGLEGVAHSMSTLDDLCRPNNDSDHDNGFWNSPILSPLTIPQQSTTCSSLEANKGFSNYVDSPTFSDSSVTAATLNQLSMNFRGTTVHSPGHSSLSLFLDSPTYVLPSCSHLTIGQRMEPSTLDALSGLRNMISSAPNLNIPPLSIHETLSQFDRKRTTQFSTRTSNFSEGELAKLLHAASNKDDTNMINRLLSTCPVSTRWVLSDSDSGDIALHAGK